MTHLDEGVIQALVHGELLPAQEAEAIAHADACEQCRMLIVRSREEDRWILGRLGLLDAPAPAARLSVVADMASGGTASPAWRRAAAVALVLVAASAGVAMAIPAVRTLVASVFGRDSEEAGLPLPSAGRPSPSAALPAAGGIAVVPGASFTVRFAAEQDSGLALVRIVQPETLSVRTTDPGVSFESQEHAITVRNLGSSASYEIDLPGASEATVIVGGRVLFTNRGGKVTTASARDSSGVYVLDLRRPR